MAQTLTHSDELRERIQVLLDGINEATTIAEVERLRGQLRTVIADLHAAEPEAAAAEPKS
jgi:hypothetical protein